MDSCKFPTDEISVLKISIGPKKIPPKWDIQSQISHFWSKIFQQEEKFPTAKI